jgi:hypothetical protein
MGDISRHRDIFLNTRDAIPTTLLDRCKIKADEMTFLELGNYLTDVSQFRDPVTYIFAKQKIWRENVLPGVAGNAYVVLLQTLAALASIAATAALVAAGKVKYAPVSLATLPLQGLLSDRLHDKIADVKGLDDWIDQMFGKPFEKLGSGAKKKSEDYGYVGQFFEHFIEGITHLLFAREINKTVPGNWGKVTRVPEKDLAAVYKNFYTQYYPHEHTDQPPYVWDASKRPQNSEYQPSTRQKNLSNNNGGIMKVVDDQYIRYLAEELSKLEDEFPRIKDNETDKRHHWLVRMGKVLHGIEDWYFHSNIVELIHFSAFRTAHPNDPLDEAFLKRFIEEELKSEPGFLTAATPVRNELTRKFYRRLRFAVYDRGTKTSSTGIPNKERSILSLDHAYPAFPSQQDTAHTLIGALENLERKGHAGTKNVPTEWPPWASCVIQKFFDAGDHWRKAADKKAKARGLDSSKLKDLDKSKLQQLVSSPPAHLKDQVQGFIGDVLREWLPLVVTLLSESERQRLVADVDPLQWTGPATSPKPPRPGKGQVDAQKKLHEEALKQRTDAQGHTENNYTRGARYLRECGFLNAAGEQAIVAAFNVDAKAEKMQEETPGPGGFLIQFAVELQKTLDEAEAATERLNKTDKASFLPATDNGSFNEIIGSHSLMSKDTLTSTPFFDDANVLASLASQSVFHIMLEEVSAPATDRLNWQKILQFFIRYPEASVGWERRALAFFKNPNGGKMPKFEDLPELAQLKSARLPAAAATQLINGKKASDLEARYVKLEKDLSHYRYP